MTFFHKHIPNSWVARPQMINARNQSGAWTKENAFPGMKLDPTVIYSVNNNGYREANYKDTYSTVILSFGMSSTYGIGVHNEQIYTRLIEQETKIETLNFGIPGASSDTVARMVSTTVPYFNDIGDKVIVILGWPYASRRELIMDNFSASINFHDKPPVEDFFKLLDDTSDKYNLEKNQLLARSLCKSLNIDLYEIDDDLYTTSCLKMDIATDGFHPGPQWHRKVADTLLAKIVL